MSKYLERSTYVFGTRCTAVLGSYENACGEVSLWGRWWVITGIDKPGLIRPCRIKSGTIKPKERVQNAKHMMVVPFGVYASPHASDRLYLVWVKLMGYQTNWDTKLVPQQLVALSLHVR